MKHTDLVCEMQGDVLYEYYPIGQYIVAAPVCAVADQHSNIHV